MKEQDRGEPLPEGNDGRSTLAVVGRRSLASHHATYPDSGKRECSSKTGLVSSSLSGALCALIQRPQACKANLDQPCAVVKSSNFLFGAITRDHGRPTRATGYRENVVCLWSGESLSLASRLPPVLATVN